MDKMLRLVITAVQQIVPKFNGAVLEEAKLVVNIRIVLNLIEQNGH
jgi:hypothetical protein